MMVSAKVITARWTMDAAALSAVLYTLQLGNNNDHLQ